MPNIFTRSLLAIAQKLKRLIESASQIGAQIDLPQDNERYVKFCKYILLSLVTDYLLLLRIINRAIRILAWVGMPVCSIDFDSSTISKHEVNICNILSTDITNIVLRREGYATFSQFLSNPFFYFGDVFPHFPFCDTLKDALTLPCTCFWCAFTFAGSFTYSAFYIIGARFALPRCWLGDTFSAYLAYLNAHTCQLVPYSFRRRKVLSSKFRDRSASEIFFSQCGWPFFGITSIACIRAINNFSSLF